MKPEDLVHDCDNCVALCCVAPGFKASARFAIGKPEGRPCPNLRDDDRCAIHHRLTEAGFPGCVEYQCYGAGQKVTNHHYAGRSWRDGPETARDMFTTYFTVKALHELMSYLVAARAKCADAGVAARLDAAIAAYEADSFAAPATLAGLDVEARREEVRGLIAAVGETLGQS